MWPVSAAVIAAWIVSRSRISPTRITSGSIRKRPANRLGEVGHVDADLALVDGRFLVLVVILDRVLDRDDMPVEVVVDIVDHRGQAGRLARPGGAGDQDQAARPLDQVADDRRRAQLLEREKLVGDPPQHQADIAFCLNTATRNRAMSPKAKPKSVPPTSCNSCWQRSGVMLFISATVSEDSRILVANGRM